ncbi:hypothetical protein LCGC14_2375690 [marine sediment metagenome]|uniref:Uncharacterized protein n=1 Tax=marine sediment metagenome TaxID=412755 RepID=A0A0F9EEV7_9ZZZZ
MSQREVPDPRAEAAVQEWRDDAKKCANDYSSFGSHTPVAVQARRVLHLLAAYETLQAQLAEAQLAYRAAVNSLDEVARKRDELMDVLEGSRQNTAENEELWRALAETMSDLLGLARDTDAVLRDQPSGDAATLAKDILDGKRVPVARKLLGMEEQP